MSRQLEQRDIPLEDKKKIGPNKGFGEIIFQQGQSHLFF